MTDPLSIVLGTLTVGLGVIFMAASPQMLHEQAMSLEREIELERREMLGAKKQSSELQQELKEVRKGLEKAADSTQRQVIL